MVRVHSFLLIAFVLLASSSCSQPENEPINWEEDLEFYLRAGEVNHIDLYHSMPREEVAARTRALVERLPTLSDNQALVELMRIARLFGDGHTAVYLWGQDFARLPLGLDDYRLGYAGDYRIVEASADYKDLLGQKLISIDGTPLEAIIEQLQPVTQYVENRHSQAVRIRQYMVIADVLNGLGIMADASKAEAVVENQDGVRRTVTVEALANSDYRKAEKVSANNASRVYVGEQVMSQSANLWMSADDNGTAYIYFAVYPSFSDMDSFGAQARAYLQENNSRNLIIDLRNNGGGDFFVGLVLASHVLLADSLDWREGIYVLIGEKVFSASMSNAAHYRQILNARLIGSPTGANPNGYQETHSETLPSSQLAVTFSKRNYRFQDEPSQGIQPDIEVANTWADYRAGRDEVLDWVLNDIAARGAPQVR